jgi:hypothetical protein
MLSTIQPIAIMRMNFQTILCCIGLWFLLGQGAWAQENDATARYRNQPLQTQTFDASVWQKTAKDMNFSTQPSIKKVPKRTNNQQAGPIAPANRNEVFSARSLLLLLATVLLIFVIYKAVAGNAILINKPIERRQPVALKDIETNLQEADVEGFLAQSLKEKDYRLAIRLYYLAIIKELAAKGMIDWKRDKTNGHYLRELRRKKYPNAPTTSRLAL